MARPPDCVVLVARTHWLVGIVIAGSIGLLYWSTRQLPIEFGFRTYAITGSLAVLYLLGGTLVWFGAPLGRVVSRVCALLYLSRPRLGSRLWETMDSAEFKAHFVRRNPNPSHY